MLLPLTTRGRIVGLLALAHDEPGYLTDDHAQMLRPFAGQAAVAIDNAQLFEQTQRAVNEQQSLLEVSRAVASKIDLQGVLSTVLAQLERLFGITGASVLTIEGDHLVFRDAMNIPGSREQVGLGIPLASADLIWKSLSRREAVIIPDVLADTPMAADYRRIISELGMWGRPPFTHIRSWMAVPLFVQDRIIGMLSMSRTTPESFTPDHTRLASIFADHVAVAIENARLYEQAQGVAALEERQRLARELHDSVSQALYGIALGARTARTQLDRDPSKAAEPVEYILSLAEAGLAEMRALIFELRPESLEQEGLVAAIEKQIAAGRARYGIQIDAVLPPEPDVPVETKEVLYRIAQEALHNVVKHANATSVALSLAAEDSQLVLRLADNGSGFDADQEFAGHLGLRSMKERAALGGGTLDITSSPGKGTTIVARIPARR
jgi:signal transduction histidine kinase